jgi:succinyl-CoA synthetase beta subunit
MPEKLRERDMMARSYASRHLTTDPGTIVVYYLPKGASQREIRLLEVNELIVARDAAPLEALDLGVDVDGDGKLKLLVLDVTPAQWEQIRKKELRLPKGWSMDEAVEIRRSSREKG